MSAPPRPLPIIPLDAAERIHWTCNRFEDAWAGPTRPRLAAFLACVPEPERSWLLAELLALEVELRRVAGERPAEAEYQQSFPGEADGRIIAAAFQRCADVDGESAPTFIGGHPLPAPPSTLGSSDRTAKASDPVIKSYEILGVLGRGGMGVVYKARDVRLKRLVALKLILAGDHAGEEHLARFRIEAEMVARLQHPNIVQIFEVGEQDGHPFIAFEYIEGKTLADFAGHKPQPPRLAAELLEAMARAMHYAHQHGVVHRDLKPANILLQEVQNAECRMQNDQQKQQAVSSACHSAFCTPHSALIPKISDFGLAKDLASGLEHTSTGTILGTPNYMSPEQAQGRVHAIGPASDIYSLGAILYVLLTGRPPFLGTTALETLAMVAGTEPVAPSQLQPTLPKDLNTICLKCLHKDPARRYESAGALADELVRFLNDEPILARPSGVLEKAWRWCRHNRAVASLMAAVAATLLLGATAAAYFAIQANLRASEEAKARQDAEAEKALALAQKDRAERISAVATLLRVGLIHETDPGGALALLEDPAAIRVDLRDPAWGFYRNSCRRRVRGLPGHAEPVTSVTWSPDGKTLASAGISRFIKLWDVKTGKEKATLLAATWVGALAFSPDGETLASAGWDRDIALWDVPTGKKRATLTGHTNPVRSLAWSPDGKTLASAGADRTIRLWGPRSGKQRTTLAGHEQGVNSVAFSPDGNTLATGGGEDGTPGELKLWDVRTGQERAFKGLDSKVTAVAWSSDSKTLASAGWNDQISLWDAAGGLIPIVALEAAHTRGIHSLAWSADGKMLASGGADKAVKLWDMASRRERACFTGHPQGVQSVAFSPDGKTLASASKDGAVRLWQTGTSERAAWQAHGGMRIQAFSFTRDGKTLASGGDDGTIELWDTAAGKSKATLRGKDMIWGVAFSPDGKTLASASGIEEWVRRMHQPGELQLWDVASGRVRKTLGRHTNSVQSVAFSPDGRTLASGGSDHTVKLWDTASGEQLATLKGHTHPVWSVAWSPDGKTLASACHLEKIKLWDMPGGKERATLKGHTAWITALAWSPDGKTLASAGWDQTIMFWDGTTGKAILTINAHNAAVMAIAWSPDGRTLASASPAERTIKLWDVASGQARAIIKSPGAITGMTWSPDGKTLVSGEPGLIKFWDLDTAP